MPVKFFDREGASGLFWGLFILFTADLCLAEKFGINGQGGILFYQDDGQITFWNGGVSYKHGGIVEDELSFVKINSGMPWLSADISVAGYSAESDLSIARAKISVGAVTSSDVKLAYGGATFLNDGADGFYLGSSLGIDVRNIEISPSVLFARMKFGHGDFYWFYGRPDLPGLARFGLSAEYEKTHKVGVTYEKFDFDILNNGATALFQSDNYSVGVSYKYSRRAPRKTWEFYAVSGFNYAEIHIDGALTPANQQYFLFPYAYYNVTGGATAFAGWAMLSLDVRGKYMEHRVKAGAGNVFGGDVRLSARYRYRKFYVQLYGGGEVSEDVVKINPAGTGIVFSAYSVESRGLAVADGVHIYLGLQKVIGYYWGIDKFKFTERAEDIPVVIDWGRLTRTALLSGLSGNLRIMF